MVSAKASEQPKLFVLRWALDGSPHVVYAVVGQLDIGVKHQTVGNQQEWDTFVKERSGGDVSVLGLPEQVVVAFAAS